ncbi:MAG: hypothetical protein KAS32_11825 [Candidatus Peribacteraceae bacterium]|nr:hypothetical protein [Candidatus Peribacteraceae bacterium]
MTSEMGLTPEQEKAVRSVERSMRNADKLGVVFWDNYGTMTAYNSNAITQPIPDSGFENSLLDHEEVVITVNVMNFKAGNADDNLYFDETRR